MAIVPNTTNMTNTSTPAWGSFRRLVIGVVTYDAASSKNTPMRLNFS